jgi:hypothetical protein
MLEHQNTTPREPEVRPDFGHSDSYNSPADGSPLAQSESAEEHQSADASQAQAAKEAVPETSCQNDCGNEVGGNKGEGEAEDESYLDDYEALQEDEETREYRPQFIEDMLENPPVPPGSSLSEFHAIFHSFEHDYKPPHRPKTDQEYYAVWRATVATCKLNWLDRMMPATVRNQQRPAVEAMHLKVQAVVPSSKKEKHEHKRHAKEGAMDYFADPDYRKDFDSQLKRGGFSANAVQAEAFERAITSLKEIDRMKNWADKELTKACEQLDRAYASRNPEQRMPLSLSATRNFNLQVKRDRELEKEERELERAKESDQNGNPQADRSE